MHVEQKVSLPTAACHCLVPFPGDNQYDRLRMEPFRAVSRFLFEEIVKGY